MVLKHPYCRTCGSAIQSENVCNHCGCAPLSGKYYCCDCGTSTVPEAIMCVHCGAGFRGKFPKTLALLVAGALIVAFAGGGYILSQLNLRSAETIADSAFEASKPGTKNSNLHTAGKKTDLRNTIVNHISLNPDDKKNNTAEIKNSPLKDPIKQPVTEKVKKETNDKEIADNVEKINSRLSTNSFSASELRANRASCSYFEGSHKNNVIFFTNDVFGYVKLNGKLYQLKGIEKGSDIAKFTGAGFTVTIEIEGLAGSEKEWLASATMVVEDARRNTLSRHRIYSSCTEF